MWSAKSQYQKNWKVKRYLENGKMPKFVLKNKKQFFLDKSLKITLFVIYLSVTLKEKKKL